jgi:hypothetical protein
MIKHTIATIDNISRSAGLIELYKRIIFCIVTVTCFISPAANINGAKFFYQVIKHFVTSFLTKF